MEQGENASKVFGGEEQSETIEKLYNESARYFADLIKERLGEEKNTIYTMADLGSFKGEFLASILVNLPEYTFDTVAIDLEQNVTKNKVAQKKVAAHLYSLPLPDKSIDVEIMRYVLAWNDAEKQKEILKEIARTVKGFAIIQHAGADSENADEWRMRMDDLLDGKEVPKLKRIGHYFSSREEVENWLTENNIPFERISERRVDAVSDVFIKRFALGGEDAEKTCEILADKDYIIQTTWLVYPQKEADRSLEVGLPKWYF